MSRGRGRPRLEKPRAERIQALTVEFDPQTRENIRQRAKQMEICSGEVVRLAVTNYLDRNIQRDSAKAA